MNKRAHDFRRKTNQLLAALDRANRCWECKLPLAEAPLQVIEGLITTGKFCCVACYQQYRTRTEITRSER